jgi:hypothetical protein
MLWHDRQLRKLIYGADEPENYGFILIDHQDDDSWIISFVTTGPSGRL